MKKFISYIIRFTITGIILFFILKKIDISNTLLIIGESNLFFLSFSLIGVFVVSFIIALRWHQILSAYKFKISLYKTFKIYMISFFFNNFLPSTVGMDIIRGAYITNDKNDLPDVISTILIERIIGFLGIIVYISLIPIFFYSQINIKYFLPTSIIGLSVSTIFFILIFNEYVFSLLFNLFNKIKIFSLGEKINKLYSSMRYIRNHKKLFLFNFILSLLIQFTFVFTNYFIVLSQNIDIALFELILFVPLISIISMIPITINGIGLREWAYITFFSNTNKEQAISLSITFFIIITLFSMLGGLYFLFEKKTKESK